MLKILSKRERIILYATIAVIVFAIGFNFLIAPLLTKNDVLNKEIGLTRTKLKNYLRLLAQKDYLETKYSSLSLNLKISAESLDPMTGALAEVEELAKNANIRIIDIRPQTLRLSDLYPAVLMDLRSEGTMEGYLRFIYNLENSPSLLRIKKFQLSARTNTPNLEGSFSISSP